MRLAVTSAPIVGAWQGGGTTYRSNLHAAPWACIRRIERGIRSHDRLGAVAQKSGRRWRFNWQGITSTIVGTAYPPELTIDSTDGNGSGESGNTLYAPGQGQEFVFIEINNLDVPSTSSTTTLTRTLIADDTRIALPESLSQGTEYLGASIPAGTKNLELEYASGGATADYDLTTGQRGPAPAILYMNPYNRLFSNNLNDASDVQTSVDGMKETLSAELSTAYLQGFGPPQGGQTVVAAQGRAWLAVNFNIGCVTVACLGEDSFKPGQVVLTASSGKHYEAQIVPNYSGTSAVFWLDVPDTFRSGTLTVSLASMTDIMARPLVCNPDTVTAQVVIPDSSSGSSS